MKKFFKSKWTWSVIVIILILGGLIYHARHKAVAYQFITVTQGPITETVSVTGNTTPTQSVSLGFQNSGTVAYTYFNIGDQVSAGDVIASLDTSTLNAQLAQAQANVDAQTATLNGLKAGAQPEDIAASQAALDKAQQDLANMYSNIPTASTASYSSANDAVRNQLGTFFSNAESSQPQLTFQSTDSQDTITAQNLRASATIALNTWQTELTNVNSATSSTSSFTGVLADEISFLKTVQNLLNTSSAVLNGAINLSASQLASDKSGVSAALTEVNTAVTNLNAISQNIASQNLTVAQLRAQLALKQAGSTSSQIAAQQAVVEQAQASVASANAALQNARIVAPISGVITQQDAKVGQIASPGASLVSIISTGQFEVDADVPETDIGKVSIGDIVSMTFDAFQNETFAGKVFYIDPAQTITQGVVDYKIKVSFNTPDARMKSGLTANLDIQAQQDQNALILPQYAILNNDAGTFVETLLADKTVSTTPVTLGIQDENGNVEILSGVSVGEQVLNIGLKQ